MRQISNKFFIVISLTMMSYSANAQFLKELGERVKERAKYRTEQKVDEKTDQAMDSLFVKRERKSSPGGNENASTEKAASGGSFSDVFTYAFTATIEVETYKKKKTEQNTIIQSYGDGSLLSTVENNTILHDLENERVFVIDTLSKEAQVSSMKWFIKMAGGSNIEDEKSEDVEVTKTGKTQMMNGYLCHEYVISHEDGKVEAWYAPGVEFDYSDYMQGFSKMFGKKSPPVKSQEGYVMKMVAFDKSGDKINQMEVVDLKERPITIALSDYNITELF